VMTSNLGSHEIQQFSSEAGYEQMKAAVMDIVGQHFRPEFINRIDEAVVFHSLGKEQIRVITTIQLQTLRKRLAERNLDLELSEAALDKIAEAGFDPVYGARPLKRALQQLVENPLAQKILSGEFMSGELIRVDADDKGLQFRHYPAVKASVA